MALTVPKQDNFPPQKRMQGVSPPELQAGEVSVAAVALDAYSNNIAPADAEKISPEAASLLSDDEQERVSRFLFDRDRRRFTHCRAALRRIVGAYLDVPPQSLRFGYQGLGKPFVLSPQRPKLHFNVSHSHEQALIAVSHDFEIGVDIEYLARRTKSVLALAQRYFSEAERGEIEAAPAEQQRRLFFRCWTRKEAFLKATGTGLTFPLDQFCVSLEASGARLLRSIRDDTRAAGRWSLVHLDATPGYLAALASEQRIDHVRQWRLPSSLSS